MWDQRKRTFIARLKRMRLGKLLYGLLHEGSYLCALSLSLLSRKISFNYLKYFFFFFNISNSVWIIFAFS